MLAKNKEPSARSKGNRRLCFERAERLAQQDARARTRSSSGAFTGECAELPTESRELCTAARRFGCRAGAAHGKASTHRFCAAKLLALKSIGFLMTGKKKAHSLLFFCRRFLFQIKRKCRNAGNIYRLIIVRSEDRVQILQFHIVPLARQRCVESPHPTSCASISLCRFCGRIIFAPTAHLFTIHFYLLL